MAATTYDPEVHLAAPGRRTREATMLGRALAWGRAHGPTIGRSLARAAGRARTLLLTVAGFGCVVASAWMVAVPLGLAVAGGALLALEYLSAPASTDRRR
jgi:hypothetical protein